MRKLVDRKIAAQNGICGLCKKPFTDYSDIVPGHISPRGMGGAWRDDHPDNIQVVHWWCNGEKDRLLCERVPGLGCPYFLQCVQLSYLEKCRIQQTFSPLYSLSFRKLLGIGPKLAN